MTRIKKWRSGWTKGGERGDGGRSGGDFKDGAGDGGRGRSNYREIEDPNDTGTHRVPDSGSRSKRYSAR